MTLVFTGERFTTDCQGEMVFEHWHRYLIASEQVAGKRVLDIASGEGYGSHLLASQAATVIGVDVSAEAVSHASKKYVSANLQYLAASCIDIPLPHQSFDVIVSFETIEHIHEQAAFLKEVARLLTPDGVFIISSPNRPEYSEKTGYNNEFHIKELDRDELKTLLDQHWPAQKWFAQRAAFHSMVWPLDAVPDSASVLSVDGIKAYPAELYFLVLCAKQNTSLNAVRQTLTLVADRENSVYAEWSRTYQENAALKKIIEQTQVTKPSGLSEFSDEPWLVRLAKRLCQ